MVSEKNHLKVEPVRLSAQEDLEKFAKCLKQWKADFCEPISSMLRAELACDPKIKVVPLTRYYNFSLVTTSMQSLYRIVQTRSNILHSNDD